MFPPNPHVSCAAPDNSTSTRNSPTVTCFIPAARYLHSYSFYDILSSASPTLSMT